MVSGRQSETGIQQQPAWCLWDMLTHPRYGMGKRLGAADVDKWALYAIGQYCDQTVRMVSGGPSRG
ncbi:hypothetical protein EWT44_00055 [Escherichia coli O25b:H4]|nr:hypothetical protein EWT44_00055 [Escherichia coli O25b:H4]